VAYYGGVPQALLPGLGTGHNKQLFCLVSTSASLRLCAMDLFLLVRGFFTAHHELRAEVGAWVIHLVNSS